VRHRCCLAHNNRFGQYSAVDRTPETHTHTHIPTGYKVRATWTRLRVWKRCGAIDQQRIKHRTTERGNDKNHNDDEERATYTRHGRDGARRGRRGGQNGARGRPGELPHPPAGGGHGVADYAHHAGLAGLGWLGWAGWLAGCSGGDGWLW
jgi:hypothetical protein